MKFKFALFSAVILLMGGTLVFVAACNKQGANTAQTSSTTIIADARHYFESSVLPKPGTVVQSSQNPLAAVPKTPIWELAYTTKTALGNMVVVPVSMKSNFYFKTNNGNQTFSAGLFTSLVVYKDNAGSYHAVVVTKIPDGSYVADLSANKKFNGIARIEDWQGNFIKSYHYTNNVSDKYYATSSFVNRVSRPGTSSLLEDPTCIISEVYNCASDDQGDLEYCELQTTIETCQGDDGGEAGGGDGGGGGGGGTVYQDVYHYTGAGSGAAGGTWSSSTNVGQNLCNTISFSVDATGALIANFNNVAEVWYNPNQGSVAVTVPTSCIRVCGASAANASSVFDQAYNYGRGQVANGLTNGSVLPANVVSAFVGAVGYYLHIGYPGSTWNAYSTCSATAPVNTPSFCDPIAP